MTLGRLVVCIILIVIGCGIIAFFIVLMSKGDNWFWDWVLEDDEDDEDG